MAGWLRSRLSEFVENRIGPEYKERTDALAIRTNEYGYDQFGFHRDSLKYPLLLAQWMYRRYFRAELHGVENVPSSGPVLLVANHSGQLPFDGLIIGTSLFLDGKPPRMVRSMVEKFVPTVPFASYLFNRWGQIVGTPENCRRLLQDDEAILVFPEGARGISKPFSQRYQLADFGHGFMRLALEHNTPITPIAVIGAEEQAPAVNIRALAKLLGTPAFPLVPYPPFVPVLPLPVKYHIYFGEPMTFTGDPDDDDEIIGEKVRAVRNHIQSLLHLGLRERNGIFR